MANSKSAPGKGCRWPLAAPVSLGAGWVATGLRRPPGGGPGARGSPASVTFSSPKIFGLVSVLCFCAWLSPGVGLERKRVCPWQDGRLRAVTPTPLPPWGVLLAARVSTSLPASPLWQPTPWTGPQRPPTGSWDLDQWGKEGGEAMCLCGDICAPEVSPDSVPGMSSSGGHGGD